MSFADDLRRFVVKVQGRPQEVLVGVATKAQQSIKGTGSPDPITGAPGQPVDTGFLRDSWTLQIRPGEAEISTNVAYAKVVEDNDRSAFDPKGETLDEEERTRRRGGVRRAIKSTVGGAHSVKMTINAASQLQAAVLRELGQ